MKWLTGLLVVVMFFSSFAVAEINIVNPGTRDSYYGNFCMTYDPQTQTYWVMIRVDTYLGSLRLPFLTKYRVYKISHDMNHISFVFETPHSIYSMAATTDGIVYAREIWFNYTSAELYRYDIQSNKNERCVPSNVTSLCGTMDGSPIYFRQDVGLCIYNSVSNSETVLINEHVITWDENCCLYQCENGSTFAYLFQSGKTLPIVLPDHISRISRGYLLDIDNMLLYGPDHDIVSIPFIDGADSVSMSDGFVCAVHSSSEVNTLDYTSIIQPDKIVSVTLPPLLDRNLNIHNGYAFFYTKHASEISVVNLSTNTVETIILPR